MAQTTALNTYEAMFLLPGPAGTDLEAALKLVRGMIEKHEGKILVIKKWDERKLCYEVGRQKRGLYILAYYKGPAASVTPLTREVELSDNVLRVLVTRVEYLNEQEMAAVEPQPIQPREERAPWDRPEPRGDSRGGEGRGDRPPYGDRPPFNNDRPAYGDRPPQHDRPHADRPHADRPPRAAAPVAKD